MSFLASGGQTVRKWMFAPVDATWSGPTPDHEVYFRPDYTLCCTSHEARSVRADPGATERPTDAPLTGP